AWCGDSGWFVMRTLLLVNGLAVCRHSRAKEAALLWKDYYCSHDVQREVKERTLGIPACRSLAEAEPERTGAIPRPPSYRIFRGMTDGMRTLGALHVPIDQLDGLKSELRLYSTSAQADPIR
ncbi:MAG: hypothetical protein J7639_28690, partial [Paenibacillaceae bacterium]|nr:hypothetical protein [Paenibacillaceae bacterium]